MFISPVIEVHPDMMRHCAWLGIGIYTMAICLLELASRLVPVFSFKLKTLQGRYPVAMTACTLCGLMKKHPGRSQLDIDILRSNDTSGFYNDQWMCSRECLHAAGDRTGCLVWDCPCTHYAKRRRCLRQHRAQMRIMDNFINDYGIGWSYRNS